MSPSQKVHCPLQTTFPRTEWGLSSEPARSYPESHASCTRRPRRAGASRKGIMSYPSLQADNKDLHDRWKLATRTVAYPDGCRGSGCPSNSEISSGSSAHLKRVGKAGKVSDSRYETGCFR